MSAHPCPTLGHLPPLPTRRPSDLAPGGVDAATTAAPSDPAQPPRPAAPPGCEEAARPDQGAAPPPRRGGGLDRPLPVGRSGENTSELQYRSHLVIRHPLEPNNR